MSVMGRLRPPSSRPLRLVYDFSTEVYTNYGFTFELEAGEQPISPGDGTVGSVTRRYVKFKHTIGVLTGTPSYEITIIHGEGITSIVSGLASVSVQPGNYISRGDVLGIAMSREIFFGVSYNGEVFSPHELGRHWRFQGEYVPGQAGKLRFAPDKLIRNFAGTVASTLYGGIRFFIDTITGFKPLLVNVDFNGNGNKQGTAVLGIADDDYWNVYAAGAFNWLSNVNVCTYYYYYYSSTGWCGPTKVFNVSPQTWLMDYTGAKSPVWLERIAVATAAAGTLANWDEMLSTWIGGFSGMTPEENFFSIRGLVAGSYRLCLYSDPMNRIPAIGSIFGAAVDNGTPVWKTTVAAPATSFVENVNYVTYDLTVPAGSVITVKAYGYFDGLQVMRLT